MRDEDVMASRWRQPPSVTWMWGHRLGSADATPFSHINSVTRLVYLRVAPSVRGMCARNIQLHLCERKLRQAADFLAEFILGCIDCRVRACDFGENSRGESTGKRRHKSRRDSCKCCRVYLTISHFRVMMWVGNGPYISFDNNNKNQSVIWRAVSGLLSASGVGHLPLSSNLVLM